LSLPTFNPIAVRLRGVLIDRNGDRVAGDEFNVW
jgi:hypothetical protein